MERFVAPDSRLSEAQVRDYMRQLCQAVAHIHKNNIVHLDIKVRPRKKHCLFPVTV